MSAARETTKVHVWQIELQGDPAKLRRCSEYLNEAERSRAARFHFRQDRERFVLARGSLRWLLASYLGQPPHRVAFRYGPHGKPELAEDNTEPRLFFNLSHSHELGICAVTFGRQVGADLERIRAEALDSVGIAERFFTPGETATVQGAPPDTRAETFLRIWTRKEALLKGHGKGLAMPLNEFEVSLEHSKIRWLRGDGPGEPNWSLHEFRPGVGYVAAIAVEAEGPGLEFLPMRCDVDERREP